MTQMIQEPKTIRELLESRLRGVRQETEVLLRIRDVAAGASIRFALYVHTGPPGFEQGKLELYEGVVERKSKEAVVVVMEGVIEMRMYLHPELPCLAPPTLSTPAPPGGKVA
jgi:hypothetical protein